MKINLKQLVCILFVATFFINLQIVLYAKDVESLYLEAVELEDTAVTKDDYKEVARTYELILSSFEIRENEELMASILYSLAEIYHKQLNHSEKAVKILKIVTSQLSHTSWYVKANTLLGTLKKKLNPFLNIGISEPSIKDNIYPTSNKNQISRTKTVGDIEMVEIVDQKIGFAISHPTEFWEKIDNTTGSPANDIHLILYRIPGENTENIPVTNIVVLTKNIVKPFDPLFMAEQYKDELGLDNPSTKIINKKEVIKDRFKGISFTLKTMVDSQKLTQRWILIAGKKRGFLIGATIPETFYYTFVSEIDSILNSFEIKGL